MQELEGRTSQGRHERVTKLLSRGRGRPGRGSQATIRSVDFVLPSVTRLCTDLPGECLDLIYISSCPCPLHLSFCGE